jgi:hypothetical protein
MAQQATASAPQAAVSAPQATALLQQALAALSGGHPISDVTLTGSAQYVAGSDEESGTAVLKAIAAGASSLSLNLSSGTRSEIQNYSTMPPSGAWSGPDGVSHTIVDHNLHTVPSWFFPIFTIGQGLSAPGYVAIYVGQETRNGQTVQHVSISQPIASSYDPTGLFQRLSQVEIYLDAGTLLPSAISYNVHPDDNGLLDIPVEVQFSNYQAVSGSQVPYHVQKFMNNVLILDIQAQSVTLNTGLNATAFSIQ